MLHNVSWAAFVRIILLLTTCYYVVILLLYYRRGLRRFVNRSHTVFLFALTFMLWKGSLYAQTADGNNGLAQANTMVRGYYDTAVQLMYAIGAISGLIGAIRIATRRHREELNSEIAIWFGVCIFLVVAATVLKAFFGL